MLRSGGYNFDPIENTFATAVKFSGVGRAIQSAKDECDINVIVKRFGLTGQLPVNARVPLVGDFEGVFDYATALQQLNAASESFMEMPAEVRERFNNDPGRFLSFCSSVKDGKLENLEEMRKLGLAVKAVEVVEDKPIRVTVVS